MPREASFNFTPAHLQGQINITQNCVSISPRGIILFYASYVKEEELAGKFIKFFVDPGKRGLAWTIRKNINLEDLKQSEWRILKIGNNKAVTLSITKFLKPFDIEGSKFIGLEVKKYKDPLYGELHYVVIPRVNEALTQKDQDRINKLKEEQNEENN